MNEIPPYRVSRDKGVINAMEHTDMHPLQESWFFVAPSLSHTQIIRESERKAWVIQIVGRSKQSNDVQQRRTIHINRGQRSWEGEGLGVVYDPGRDDWDSGDMGIQAESSHWRGDSLKSEKGYNLVWGLNSPAYPSPSSIHHMGLQVPT